MMTAARKSFALSLAFHTLMGSLGFWVLTLSHTPPPLPEMESRKMVLVPLGDPAPTSHHLPDVDPMTPPLPAQASVPMPQPRVEPPARVAKTPTPEPRTATPAPTAAPEPSVVAAPSALPNPPRHQASDTVPPPPPPAADLTSEKKAFFASLRTTIQNHLRYPSAARRRGMQGEVSVRFTLQEDGRIEGIAIDQGAEVFHNAARSAVAAASGIAIPKTLQNAFPQTINLTLEFRLGNAAG